MESLSLEHRDEVWSVACSGDGLQMASGSWDGTLALWNAQTGARLSTLESGKLRIIFQAAFTPDGKQIAAATGSQDLGPAVRVWDTATANEVFTFRGKKLLLSVTYDPTGQYLLHEVYEGPTNTVRVQVRDAHTGKEVGVIGRHDQQIWGMTFSPDGRLLATASSDGTVRVWPWDPKHVGSEQPPRFILPARVGGYGNRLAFSSDSQHLATAGEEQTVKIWNAQTGEKEHGLAGHSGGVFALAFSPDGRWLASAGEDSTIRIWDAQTWKFLRKLRGHTGWINSLAFSRDSLRLASGSRDHTMKLWDTARWSESANR
jgi:WD40 repeat protein